MRRWLFDTMCGIQKEGTLSTVMCAYPKLSGVHCSDHKGLLTDILRDEWGFNGLVVTDWGTMNDRIKGFRAGCNLRMPGGNAYNGDGGADGDEGRCRAGIRCGC